MGRLLLGAFTLTLFQSALLLFWVQPMVGKILLPYLGGTPAVWNTCMVFFQALLLGGYSYAHLLSGKKLATQCKIHLGLLLSGMIPLLLLHFQVEPISQYFLPVPTESNPIPWLLAVLLICAGLPFFAVSTTAPLLQSWFSGTNHRHAHDPYFLYAASNLGSMIALLGYPFIIEPSLPINHQANAWIVGYAIFMGLVAFCAKLAGLNASPQTAQSGPATIPAPPPPIGICLGWVAMAFIPSSLMIGTTTHLTTDIAPIPLLWILPLTAYLLTFILVFSRVPGWLFQVILLGSPMMAAFVLAGGARLFSVNSADEFLTRLGNVAMHQSGWSTGAIVFILAMGLLATFLNRSANRQHAFMVILLPFVLVLVCLLPFLQPKLRISEFVMIVLHLGLLFLVAMVCHGELARSRPAPEHLTSFYLAMSLGGVLGGIFNTIIAPVAFNKVVEYPLVAVLACLIVPGFTVSPRLVTLRIAVQTAVVLIGILVGTGLTAKSFLPRETARKWLGTDGFTGRLFTWIEPALDTPPLVEERNFFGSFRIEKSTHFESYWNPLTGSQIFQERIYHRMLHGTTNHGMQIFEPAELRREPITYFQNRGAIGQIFEELVERAAEKKRPPRVAVLGVGTGTLAAYAENGWSMTLFEIDKAMMRLAYQTSDYFTFMRDAQARGAKIEVRLGDGRKCIENHDKETDGTFDILFMDAFASDSVPVHLLTREAFMVYFEQLGDDGMVVVNIANRYLDFEPVLANLAQSQGWRMILQRGDQVSSLDKYATSWVVISKKTLNLDRLASKSSQLESNGNEWTETWQEGKAVPSKGVWTDSYSNIVNIFNWTRD